MDNLIDRYKELLGKAPQVLSGIIGFPQIGPSTQTQAKFARDTAKNLSSYKFGQNAGDLVSNKLTERRTNKAQQSLNINISKLFERANRPGTDLATRTRLLRLANEQANQSRQLSQGFLSEANQLPSKTDVALSGAGTALELYGGPKTFSRGGALTAGIGFGLGGAAGRFGGEGFAEGAARGLAATPKLRGITSITNPLIEKGVSRFAPQFSGRLGNFLSQGASRGALNIPEGAAIDVALGNQPLNPASVAVDFTTGFIGTDGRTGAFKNTREGLDATASSKNVDEIIKRGQALGLDGINPRAFKMNDESVKEIEAILDTLDKSGVSREARFEARKGLQNFLDAFAPGYQVSSDNVAKKVANYLLDVHYKVPKDQRVKLPRAPKLIEDSSTGNINTKNLEISKQGREQIESVYKEIKPKLEQVKGKKLSFDEVRQESAKADVLKRAVSREQTKRFEASLLTTRERLTTLNEEITRAQQSGNTVEAERLTRELIDTMRVTSSQAADIGRKLGSFRILAKERPFRERLLEDIIKANELTDEQIEIMTREAAKVDWSDTRQVADFYRQYVTPSVTKMLEEYRYFNLLSSPRTHIVNVFSNSIQAFFVRPSTKLAAGVIDPIASALTGKARENYISEVPVYYRGLFASIPDAFKNAGDVVTGKQQITNLDIRDLSRQSGISKFNYVTRALEAGDQFFRTLVRGAEQQAFAHKFGKSGKNVSQVDIDDLAEQTAMYTVFRQGLDTQNATGQGIALSWIDKGTSAATNLRRVPGMGWFIPFIQTPMNIFKQGFEYSPLGVATTIGASNKTEQLAKSAVGSMVFAGAGYLALQNRITWASPTDNEQRKAFYAAGYQPYSVKIGDKWVSFSKMGPLAYPMALAAAIKWAYQDNPEAVASGEIEKLGSALTGVMGFFSDQSYMQGIGDLVNAVQGQEGYRNTFTTAASNIAGQYVPLSSLQRWVTQVVDPYYRKGETIGENLAKGIPGLSDEVGTYENPYGDPSRRQFPEINAFSPLSVTAEDPEFKELYDLRQQELQGNALLRREEKELEKQLEDPVKAGVAEASEEVVDTQDRAGKLREKKQLSIAKKRVELQGGIQEVGDYVVYEDDEGSVRTLNFSKYAKKVKGVEKIQQDKDKRSLAKRIVSDQTFTPEQQSKYLKKLDITRTDALYDYYSGLDNDEKTAVLVPLMQGREKDSVLRSLAIARQKGLSGDILAANGVLDNLVDAGILTKEEAKALKKVESGKKGTITIKQSGGSGRKAKRIKISIPKGNASSPAGRRPRLKLLGQSSVRLNTPSLR